MWQERGFLLEKVTDEERRAGGKWIIGDGQSDGHPGKSSMFRYKTWKVHPPDIGSIFPSPDQPCGDGCLYLGPLDGVLIPGMSDGKEGVHIPGVGEQRWMESSSEYREQQSAHDGAVARGFTFVADRPGRQIAGGFVSERYEIRRWDLNTLLRLSAPEYLSTWTLQCVEVFAGEVLCRISTDHVFPEIYPIGPGPDSRHSHVFLRRDITRSWERFAQQARGVVLYVNFAP